MTISYHSFIKNIQSDGQNKKNELIFQQFNSMNGLYR